MISPALLAGLLLLMFFASNAVAEPISVAEFNRQKDQWGDLVGKRITLQGRYAAASVRNLRMKNCDLKFVAQEDLPRLTGSGTNVEVSGRIRRVKGELVFEIALLRKLPSDQQLYLDRRRKLDANSADGWYALAKWASERGEFYEDETLLKLADDAYRSGFNVERRKLKPGDAQGLYDLADRAAKLEFPESVRNELIHEGFRAEWEAVRKAEKPDYQGLRKRLSSALPGCEIPPEVPQTRLRGNYQRDPLNTYREADAATRRKLHRMLYADLTLELILQEIGDDARNGYAIADRINEELPEFRDLAEVYRQGQLDDELAHVSTASRRDLDLLAERYRKRNRPDKAREAQQKWLQAREKTVRPDDVSGLAQLADEYQRMLDDDEAAARLLLQAARLQPQAPEISERLAKLDFEFREGKWVRDSAVKNKKDDPFSQMTISTGLRRGMSAEDVRKEMGGLPSSSIRTATSRGVNEVWVYQVTGIAVYLARESRDSPLTVTGISQLRRR